MDDEAALEPHGAVRGEPRWPMATAVLVASALGLVIARAVNVLT